MGQLTSYWGNAVVRFRWAILFVTAMLMILAPLSFSRLYYDNSNDAYFLENDPSLTSFSRLLEYFGDSEYLVIGLSAKESSVDVLNAELLQLINEVTVFLENHRYITQVRSLAKYQHVHDQDGMLVSDSLFEDIESLQSRSELLTHARDIILSDPIAIGSLVTQDLRHTRIVARVEYIKNTNDHNIALVTDLMTFIKEQNYLGRGYELHLSGVPVIAERFESLTKSDQLTLNPIMGVAMILILYLVFRSIFAMLVPFVVVFATLFFLSSIQGILLFPNTAVNSALIPTMIILSMGACVHVLVEFFQARSKGLSPKESASVTTRDLLLAILFTSLTTSFGFIALSVTDLKPVRQFSILAAIGPIIIFILACSVLPAILSFVSWMPRHAKRAATGHVSVFLREVLPSFTSKYKVHIAVLGALISLFSFYSIQHLRVDANVVNYFKQSNTINQDLHYFNRHFKGISHLEIIIDSGALGGSKEPDFLRRVDNLQIFIESFDETGKAISIINMYKRIHQVMHDGQETYYSLPKTRQQAAQLLLLYENSGADDDFSDYRDFSGRYLRISVPVINMNVSEQSILLERIRQGIKKHFSDLHIDLTGSLVMNNVQNEYVNTGMFQSFGVAMLVIGLSFIFLFCSFKHGVIALLPSVVPILLTGGIISYAGIALDLGTMIIGAMSIGIAVDDSIHIMSRYRLMKKRGNSTHDSIAYAMCSSGRAVVLTSIILVVGFCVMLFGNFIPYIYVGLFSAMIMIFALLGDLIFMPALLYLVDGDELLTSKPLNSSQHDG